MYNSERVKWWRERSVSLEYQFAYRNIAQIIPKKSGTLVDVGCGTGEMIKLLHPYFGQVIGTDASEKMLNIARRNLRNIEGVRLIRDNIFVSKLQPEIADVTLLAFPDFRFKGTFSEEDEELIEKLLNSFAEKFGNFPEDKRDFVWARLLPYHNLARITKSGGHVVTASYDLAEGGNSEAERTARVLAEYSFHGLELKSEEFFESPEIWRDTFDWRELESRFPDAEKGYRVSVFQKTNSKIL